MTDALVCAVTESEVPVGTAVDVERVRVRDGLIVAVAGREAHHQPLALLDLSAAQLGVPRGGIGYDAVVGSIDQAAGWSRFGEPPDAPVRRLAAARAYRRFARMTESSDTSDTPAKPCSCCRGQDGNAGGIELPAVSHSASIRMASEVRRAGLPGEAVIRAAKAAIEEKWYGILRDFCCLKRLVAHGRCTPRSRYRVRRSHLSAPTTASAQGASGVN
jgi:hypothetical protein